MMELQQLRDEIRSMHALLEKIHVAVNGNMETLTPGLIQNQAALLKDVVWMKEKIKTLEADVGEFKSIAQKASGAWWIAGVAGTIGMALAGAIAWLVGLRHKP